MASGHDAIELARLRRMFMARAALERAAMRMATEDIQDSTDRIARIERQFDDFERRIGEADVVDE